MSPTRILVTGGAGFVGSYLTESLVRRGHRVLVLDNFSTGRRENLPDGIPQIQGDVRDGALVAGVLADQKPEVVFHLAAQMNVRRSLADPLLDADVNVLGGVQLVREALNAGVKRVVFSSSGGAVYGDQERYPCKESDLPRPSSPYGVAKLALEHYGRALMSSAGRAFLSLRLANVFGPRQNPRGEAGIVALFLRDMLEGRNPTIIGDGDQTRDFVWIEDVIDAFLKALDGPPGTYNIGTGIETSVNSICRRLKALVGFPGEPRRLKPIGGEVRRNALDCDLARRRLGWVHRTPLDSGMMRMAKAGVGTRAV